MVPTSSQPTMPIRIVHVISGLRTGGAETVLLRLIQGSSAAAVEHVVVSLTGRGDLGAAIEAAGGKVVTPNLRSPGSMAACLGDVRGLQPDIVQGWMAHGNLVAWLFRTFGSRRAVLAWNLRMPFTGIDREKRRTRWLTRGIACLSGKVDLLLANAESTLRDHQSIGYRPRAASVIPNGFDPDTFAPDPATRATLRAEWGGVDESVLFGLIGRYHPAKGHALFIRAAALVHARFPEAMFVLAGAETDTDPEILALLDELEVREAFRLLGRRTDVAAIMQALDVVCIPSYYESFPNVLGEGMASARAAIATDVSDVASIMGAAGRIIPPGNHEALAEAMIAMLEAGAEGRAAMGALGRARVLEHYTLRDTTDRYVEHYTRLARARRAAASKP